MATPHPHDFLFSSLTWLGEGVITFNISEDELKYRTRWQQQVPNAENEFAVTQEVEVAGFPDKMVNSYRIYNIHPDSFSIELENQLFGKLQGKGIISDSKIAWEFTKTNSGFEGIEIYERNPKQLNEYLVYAEFASPEQARTVVKGRVWLATSQSKK